MAFDWIKMTHELPEKPEVLRLSAMLNVSRYEVIGRLFRKWPEAGCRACIWCMGLIVCCSL